MLRMLDLFSGIGGFSLAASWTGQIETVAFCEIEPYCQKVLHKHWPDVPIFPDIKELRGDDILNLAKDSKYNHAVKLYEQGLSIQQVADYFRITRQAMHQILKRRGVDFRPQQRSGQENHFYRGTKASDHAQNLLEQAIEDGLMERKTVCEKCGDSGTFKNGRTKIQAHHTDYNKPLDVIWLCQKCHYEWHEQYRAIEREVMPDESTTGTIDIVCGGFPR